MTESEIQAKIDAQRKFFAEGHTYDVSYRINALKRLRRYIHEHMDELNAAIKADLGKSEFESYMC